MTTQLDSSIVRLFATGGKVVGAGFLVTTQQALTCAHVVTRALGLPDDAPHAPEGELRLDFPLLAPGRGLTARVIFWRPETDVASLQLEGELPMGARPVRLMTLDDLWGHRFRAFGFPHGHDDGVWASGMLSGKQAAGWTQIEDVRQTGFRVEPGFSGAPVWDEQLDAVVGMVAAAERRAEVKAAFILPVEALVAAWPALGERAHIEHAARVTQAPGAPPFKGLQYFDEGDADLFFGRERLTARLTGQLRAHCFLAVVGASGSGKSSVVRAGLIPALKRSELLADGTLPPEGSAGWPIHIITPTARPLEALAASLTRDSESVAAMAALIDDLARDPRSLHLAVRRILSRLPAAAAGKPALLLFVDQFEELFTLCRHEAERQVFVDNLMTAVETDGPTIVVIALRADFYAHCAQFDRLREALATRQEFIGPMSAGELRRAIEEPARRNGWEFEPGLVALLLRDAGAEPGALPLLSHALLETWRRRRGRTLTFKGYSDSGGVHGAIAQTAETVFSQLKPEQQILARSIFIRLTELGEGTQDTRRRAALAELIPPSEDAPAMQSVLKTLADARLITTGAGTAEVAHEAVIREWPRLREWLDEDREGLRLHRHLTEAAQEWAMLDRDAGALYRGIRLAAASDWAEAHAEELNTLEREFLHASLDLEQQERQAAEAHVREQQIEAAKAQAILESVADGVVVCDAAGQIILFNVAAERILGCARESVLGRLISDVIGVYGLPGAQWETQFDRWRSEPDARRAAPALSHQMQIENDRRFVDVSVAPVTGPGEEYLGTVSVFHDISREVEADRARIEFISVVSHELRTPLTGIKGYATLMDTVGSLNEQQKKFLSFIISYTDRLFRLVGDLLDISRSETAHLTLDVKPVGMTAIIDQVITSLRELIEQKKIKIEIDVPEDDPLYVLGDPARLAQVLTNLVENAYRYTRAGGQIKIQAYPTGDALRVLRTDVQDTGIGIAEKDFPRVFDRFFRAGDPLVQEYAGTGLGLSIVKALVEMHGGKVWFESIRGQGSTFSFTVPMAAGS